MFKTILPRFEKEKYSKKIILRCSRDADQVEMLCRFPHRPLTEVSKRRWKAQKARAHRSLVFN